MRYSALLLICVTALVQLEDTVAATDPCPVINLSNGRVKLRSKGRIARFKCFKNYQLVGHKLATCIRGAWDIEIPVCIKADCPAIGNIKNGQVISIYGGAISTIICDTGYTLNGIRTLYCTEGKWNKEVPSCQGNDKGVSKSCDFESEDLCGWTQDPHHNFNWTRHNYATPSGHVDTGPSFDHTLGPGADGHYMYIESSSPRFENDTARLFSPIYMPELSQDACFVLWYHMYGATTGTLNVYLKMQNANGSEMTNLFHKSGEQGNTWYVGVMQLSPVDKPFQIVIEAIRGRSYVSDIAIDDVRLEEGDGCYNITMETKTPVIRQTMVTSSPSTAEFGIVAPRTARPFPTYLPPPPPPPLPPLSPILTLMTSPAPPYLYSLITNTESLVSSESISLQSQEEVSSAETTAWINEISTSPVLPTVETHVDNGAHGGYAVTKRYEEPKSTASTIVTQTIGTVSNSTSSQRNSSTSLRPHIDTTLKSTSTISTAKPVTSITETTANTISTFRMPYVTPFPGIPSKSTNTPMTVTAKRRIGASLPTATNVKGARSKSPPKGKPRSVVGAIVGGVAVVATVAAIAIFIIVRRRMIENRRNEMAEDSDVRYLTYDEVLDFTLARPSSDDL